MKKTTKKLPKSQIEIEVELSFDELKQFIERALLRYQENLEIPGFRKGKVPRNVAEEKIGKPNILVDAADLAIRENYPKIILEEKIEAIGQPDIDIVKLAEDNPFSFKIKVSILPEVKLPDYKKIASRTERKKVLVDDKEIEETLKWLQKSRAKFTIKNEPAKIGDFVEIEYSSPDIAEISPKTPRQDSFILGEAQFMRGFEDLLIGMKSGEEKKSASLKMPENHQAKNLAGKEVKFDIKMKSVQKMELPEINDDFAKNLGKFVDLNNFKNNIKTGIGLEKEDAESQRVRAEILEGINQAFECDVPDVLVEAEKKRMLENLRHEVKDHLKISFEDYLSRIKKSEKEITESFFEESKKRVKNFLILREISKKEKIEIQDKEIEEETGKFLKRYSGVEQEKKEIDLEKLKDYTKEAMMNEKVFSLLESLAKK